MKLDQLTNNVYHLYFPTCKELGRTMLRIQESYENPHFRDEVFSRDEIKKWYTRNSANGKKKGKFTYYTDFSGFNFRGETLRPFYTGAFDPLTKREQTILHTLRHVYDEEKKFYVICTNAEDKEDLRHEQSHALWYVNEEYNAKARKIVSLIPGKLRKKMYKFLEKEVYHPEHWDDEVHAYICNDLKWLWKDEGVLNKKDYQQLKPFEKAFRKLFKEYWEIESGKKNQTS